MKNNHTKKLISKTFELAKKGAGNVSPNPLVGAILVKNGNIIGQGYHQRLGTPHAEVNAIDSAIEDVKGATLHCNLEPCCHFNKKTPPCAQRIIKEGIRKVVISNLDPNPEVNGKGVELLKNNGVEVITNVLKSEGEEINKFYFNFLKKKIPFISIKIAQSLDGFIYSQHSADRWISGRQSRLLVHQWRSEYDAVLIGANTVIIDNPLLTVRNTNGRNPLRIIIDGRLSVPANSKLFDLEDKQKTIIITDKKTENNKIFEFQNKGIQILQLPGRNYKLSIREILKELGKKNIHSILVEGGNQIFSQLISKRIFNELKIFISPKFLGKGVPAANINSELKLILSKFEKIGDDILLTYMP